MNLTGEGAVRWAARIRTALYGPAVMREWDQRFLEQMLEKLEQYGAASRLSAEQFAQLERIVGDADVSAEVAENPNPFPYADQGGTSHYVRRGYSVNKPKRP